MHHLFTRQLHCSPGNGGRRAGWGVHRQHTKDTEKSATISLRFRLRLATSEHDNGVRYIQTDGDRQGQLNRQMHWQPRHFFRLHTRQCREDKKTARFSSKTNCRWPCTSIFRPSTTVPFNFSRARSASALFAKVTKPNPCMHEENKGHALKSCKSTKTQHIVFIIVIKQSSSSS